MNTKNLVIGLLILLTFTTKSFSQITLEHVYPNRHSQFFPVKFSSIGTKYIDDIGGSPQHIINVYNLDHSLYKTISIRVDSFTVYPESFSDHLFNNDDKIEILCRLVSAYTLPPSLSSYQKVRIYNEDTTLIFAEDSVTSYGQGISNTKTIVNTSNGYKMILQEWKTGASPAAIRIYSLSGNLPLMVKPITKDVNIADAFPNPSDAKVTIPYALPTGINKGEIVFFDLSGKETKRFTVTDAFNTLELNTELSNGTYFYQLQTSQTTSGTKKLIIIK